MISADELRRMAEDDERAELERRAATAEARADLAERRVAAMREERPDLEAEADAAFAGMIDADPRLATMSPLEILEEDEDRKGLP